MLLKSVETDDAFTHTRQSGFNGDSEKTSVEWAVLQDTLAYTPLILH